MFNATRRWRNGGESRFSKASDEKVEPDIRRGNVDASQFRLVRGIATARVLKGGLLYGTLQQHPVVIRSRISI